MGDKTKIQWTNSTWNPVRAKNKQSGKTGWHCEKVSLGCGRAERGCYAEAFNRVRGTGLWFKPGNRDLVNIYLDEKMLGAPLRWQRGRMIFPCSMTDLFADFVTDEMLDKIFAVMALTPRHTYQITTKRPERARDYLGRRHSLNEIELAAEKLVPSTGKPFSPKHVFPWPLQNVWLGVSVEDQATADGRISILEDTPAWIHWVSYEPALNVVSFEKFALDWIVIGGQSGGHAGAFDLKWPRAVLANKRGAAIYIKQLGARPFEDGKRLHFKDKKGGDMAEWPEDLWVREFPA